MYRAKRGGADRIEIFNAAMRTEKDSRSRSRATCARRIEKKQIACSYQPIFYLPTEPLAGFEALMRWEHPTRGPLSADDFIPLAEESDLIVKLGSYVLARRRARGERWQKELPRDRDPLFVSVNVSSRQLFRPDLVKEVRHILGRAVIPRGLAPARDHRVAGDGEPGEARSRCSAGRSPAPASRSTTSAPATLAVLPQPVHLRHHQGRPLVPARQRAERHRLGHPALGRRARA